MAIEWITRPAWGYGGGAEPIYLTELYRRVYYNYNADSWRWLVSQPWGNCGLYTVQGASSSGYSGQYNVTDGPIYGYATEAVILHREGVPPVPHYPYRMTGITIYYPNAHVRFAISMYCANANSWQLDFKFYDEDNNEITSQINFVSGSKVGGWASAASGKNPGQLCQFAVSYEYAGKLFYGITANYTQISSGDLRLYPDNIMINIAEWSADLQRRNPDLDFGVWEEDTESPEAGPASSTGGYGGYGGDITASDSYEMDPVPTASAAALGFINMYNPSAGGLSDLGAEIFPDFEFDFVVDPTGNDLIDAILNGVGAFVDCINQIPKMFTTFMNSRLIDYVQDCHIVPVAPTVGSSAHIKLGYRELDTTAPVITNEYVVADLGSVSLSEFYQSFIDYLPFTRAKLYLPFVGFVPLEPEYWQNGKISVKYKFNVYDGSFSAHVIATPDHSKISQMASTVVGQYTGTAIIHLPLTGLNYSSMVAGLIGGAGAMVSSIASGNVAAAATAALNTATSSPQVMTSNAYTASAAFLGQRKPFIVIERSVSHFPQLYQHDVGLPSKITTNLGAASGFTTVGEVDLSGMGASSEEKAAIRSLLASGVYF